MKKRQINQRERQKRDSLVAVLSFVFIIVLSAFLWGFLTYYESGKQSKKKVSDLDSRYETVSLYREDKLYSDNLCVSDQDIANGNILPFEGDSMFCEAYFDLSNGNILYSSQLHKTIYPASTTKILTAIVAYKNGNLEDVVTVSETAAADRFLSDEQVCGLQAGDQLTLKDLLCGLMLYSGNDAAVAIAEYIGGDYSTFIDMMNAESASLFATKSHFVNPNGLHHEDHYTTPYDLYLIFNEYIQYPELVDIIAQSEYTAHITGSSHTTKSVTWHATSFYSGGKYAPIDKMTAIGGKTGTTDEAGNCLVILEENQNKDRFICIVMGSPSRKAIYERINYVSAFFP